jgi:Ca-activated chloride channel homolog
MMRHWFANPELLLVLVAVPVLGLIASRDARRRQRVLASIGGMPSLVTARRRSQLLRGLCLLLGIVALGGAISGPRWGRDFSQPAAPGRDLVVALDCSRSMLAESPSRFERARAALLDLADTLRRVGGHRVALVTFAARPRLACPLTHDYDHFRDAVASLDPRAFDAEVGPISESPSGTRIGLGLAEAARARDARYSDMTDILLLSDGDDPAHDGEWQAGVEAARAGGIPIYTIGIGDPNTPAVIVVDSHAVRHDGKEIRTKLEEAPLRAIAEETGGAYFSARQKSVAAGALYLDVIAARPMREDDDDNLPVSRDQSTWFYGSAFALLAGSILLGGVTSSGVRRYP